MCVASTRKNRSLGLLGSLLDTRGLVGGAAIWALAASLAPAPAAAANENEHKARASGVEIRVLAESRSDKALDPSRSATGAVKRKTSPLERRLRRNNIAMMVEGGGVRAPSGYERFCRLDPRYCAPPAKRRPGAMVTASRTLIDQLSAFNRSVNAEFVPEEDRTIYGVADHWTIPGTHADCEDYVLVKQSRLLKAGWPRESLLIGVVVGEESPFHAVLIVRTTKGELVLDNMTDEVREWRQTGYQWVIRQSAEYPERWVRIMEDETPATASR